MSLKTTALKDLNYDGKPKGWSSLGKKKQQAFKQLDFHFEVIKENNSGNSGTCRTIEEKGSIYFRVGFEGIFKAEMI